jgi:hypothetical protein
MDENTKKNQLVSISAAILAEITMFIIVNNDPRQLYCEYKYGFVNTIALYMYKLYTRLDL